MNLTLEVLRVVSISLHSLEGLAHQGWVTHIWVSTLSHRWFRWWLVACSVPTPYLNKLWPIINRALGSKWQWNSSQNTYVSFKKIQLKIAPFGSASMYFDRVRMEPMMTSSNGNIFRVTGHLCGEFTGPRWIPRTKASDAELWYFPWF